MAQESVGGARPAGNPRSRALRIARLVVIGIAGACAVVFICAVVFGLLVQWLWNGVLASIVNVPQITYWQALGLVVLARLLVGGLSLGGGSGRMPSRKRREPQGKGAEAPAEPAPCLSDYERYWQDEGRAAFAAYMQRLSRAKAE